MTFMDCKVKAGSIRFAIMKCRGGGGGGAGWGRDGRCSVISKTSPELEA